MKKKTHVADDDAAMSIHSPPESPTARRHRAGAKVAGPLPPPLPAAAAAAAAAALPPTPSSPSRAFHTLDACVKLLVMHTEPSFSLPWSMKRQYQSSSSGFVIPGRRIVTNAHCVEHATQVKVKRRDAPERYLAQVLAISNEADLALLAVPDPLFWAAGGGSKRGADDAGEEEEEDDGEVPAVTFADEADSVPRLQDRVLVAGFSVGGVGLSCTAGVVSRVEVQPYAHSGAELLTVQADAPISSGCSGGPCFNEEGRCIGVAFQSLRGEEAEGVGYIIPLPIVRRVLADVERHGRYTGFASLGVEWQKLENRALRRALGLPEGQSRGVLVRRVEPTAPAAAVLRRGDVLLAFDGVPIAADGTAPFRKGERIAFSYLISQKFCGDQVDLEILRAPAGALGEEAEGEEEGGRGGGDEDDDSGWGAGDDAGTEDDEEQEEQQATAAAAAEASGTGGRRGKAAAAAPKKEPAAAAAARASRGRGGGGKGNKRALGSAPATQHQQQQHHLPPLPLPPREPEVVRVRLERPVRLVPYHLEPTCLGGGGATGDDGGGGKGGAAEGKKGRRRGGDKDGDDSSAAAPAPGAAAGHSTATCSPSYFVWGGLVFTPLTAGYLRSEFGRDWESEAPVQLVSRVTHGVAREKGEQVVLLAQVLAAAVNVGFEDIVAAPVRSVNGRRVRSLRSLVRETEAALARGDPFLRFSLAHRSEVILDAREGRAATPGILRTHSIARDRSADLLEEEEEEKRKAGQEGGGGGGGGGSKKRARKAAP